MVTGPAQFEEAAEVVRQAADLETAGDMPPLGAMVESPLGATQIREVVERSAFVSIGTNDLARSLSPPPPAGGGPDGRALCPAVLKVVASVVVEATRAGRRVCVCGAAASDPLGAAILVGLGVNELSLAAAAVPSLRHVLAHLHPTDAARLARLACRGESPQRLAEELESLLPPTPCP